MYGITNYIASIFTKDEPLSCNTRLDFKVYSNSSKSHTLPPQLTEKYANVSHPTSSANNQPQRTRSHPLNLRHHFQLNHLFNRIPDPLIALDMTSPAHLLRLIHSHSSRPTTQNLRIQHAKRLHQPRMTNPRIGCFIQSLLLLQLLPCCFDFWFLGPGFEGKFHYEVLAERLGDMTKWLWNGRKARYGRMYEP